MYTHEYVEPPWPAALREVRDVEGGADEVEGGRAKDALDGEAAEGKAGRQGGMGDGGEAAGAERDEDGGSAGGLDGVRRRRDGGDAERAYLNLAAVLPSKVGSNVTQKVARPQPSSSFAYSEARAVSWSCRPKCVEDSEVEVMLKTMPR